MSPRGRAKWLRTDRLLCEHGIERDDARGRRRFVKMMEARRSEEAGEFPEFEALRRGWRLGPEDFLERLLGKLEKPVKTGHSARTLEETDEAVASSIMREELMTAGIKKEVLPEMPKGDAVKVRIARRLRAETSLTLGKISGHLHMGTPNHVSHLLFRK